MPKKRKSLNKPVVFLGNLQKATKAKDLCPNIIALFDYVGVTVKKSNITLIRRSRAKFCFVVFPDVNTVEYVVDKLHDPNAVPDHILRAVVQPGLTLKVSQSWDNVAQNSDEGKPGSSKEADSYDNESNYDEDNTDDITDEDNRHIVTDNVNSEQTGNSNPFNKKEHQSEHHITSHTGAHSDSVLIQQQQQGRQNAKATGGREGLRHFVLGANLGNETRNVEFKAGKGDYRKNVVQKHVGKYVTAFLNCEGGTLLIGVNDKEMMVVMGLTGTVYIWVWKTWKGIVEGVSLDHKEEDQMRLRIDSAITEIRPQIFPDIFSVTFVPIVDSIGQVLPNLKVVEIKVKKGPATELYQNIKGEAYLRWEGSVQGPLSANAIQEHTKRRLGEENERKEKEIQKMKSKEKHLVEKFQKLNDQSANDKDILKKERDDERLKRIEIEQEMEMLRQERNELVEKNQNKPKSKICVIS